MPDPGPPLPDVESEMDLDELFISLVENLPVHVARKDLSGRITFANQAFCRLLGLPRNEVIGKTDFDFYPKELAEKYRHDDLIVERTGQTFSDIEANYRSGESRYFEVRKTPIRSLAGKVVGTQVIFWDVSAHKRTEAELDQERQLLNALMANTPDSIFFKDAEGRFIRISRAYAKLAGLNNPGDAVGKTDADFLAADYAERSREDEQNVMRSGKSLVDKEEEWAWPDGRRTWVSTTKAPLRNYRGEIVGCFGISRDITNRKLAEEAQREAREAAEAANRAKSDFLANMSHEIRTPLNAIIGMTELVLDSELSPLQQDYLQTVLASGETLLGIINQILDFSKIEARKVELEQVPFNLREALGDTLKSLAFQAHGKTLELAWSVDQEVPEMLVGDPTRFNQIIVNLVGNAIKFTSEGEVVLRVHAEPLPATSSGSATGSSQVTERVRLHVRVSDTGIGVPPQQREAIFSAFEQADSSTTRRFGGTGLGLSISSRLAALMGGRIWVESEPNRGSTFHVEVVLRVGEQPAGTREQWAERLAGRRVLVVDDNATNRLILTENLRAWRMHVVPVDSAASALEYLQQHAAGPERPELLITDHHMPDVDGVQLLEAIRTQPEWKQLPAILLTSGNTHFELPRLRELNAQGRLLKPVKQSELRATILHALGETGHSQAEASDTPAPPIPRLQILLVEDGWANQKLAAGLLTRWGHEVIIANNGQEAVRLVQNSHAVFDLILMDVQMPVMDGLEATRRIRQLEQESGRHLPILAMTAHVKAGDEQLCLDAGMDGYLSKPIRKEQLAQAIDRIASDRAATRVAQEAQPEATPDEAVPEWDLATAMEAVDGDESLLRDVIGVFLEEYPNLLRDVETAINRHEAIGVQRGAHTIKGATRIFGSPRVAAVAVELEQAGRDGRLVDAQQLLPTLHAAVARLAESLRRF